ncbi:hypothetical protein [Vibrio splendidus]|uniref:hypothetical protein n=1 Tax=Vibrio splendidus TaxID=29497 RepID=UPI0021B36BC0|nr:hypothetical protein [Vibrio splendidus]UWZ98592.1 hypothetical protein IM698_04345 [Vibrio splendidus]
MKDKSRYTYKELLICGKVHTKGIWCGDISERHKFKKYHSFNLQQFGTIGFFAAANEQNNHFPPLSAIVAINYLDDAIYIIDDLAGGFFITVIYKGKLLELSSSVYDERNLSDLKKQLLTLSVIDLSNLEINLDDFKQERRRGWKAKAKRRLVKLLGR